MVTVTGNYIPSFHNAQGNVYYSHTAPTFAAAAAINANAVITTANQIIQMSNINFTPPKGEVEVVNLLGSESTTTGAGVPTTGSFQNQIYDDKAWTDAKLTATLVFTAHNDGASATALMPDLINAATGIGLAVSTTYHRHSFGDGTTNQTRVIAGCVFIIMKNATEEGTLVLNAPRVNLGTIKPTADDGYYTCDVEINCLCKNCVLEIKDFD